MGHGSVVAAWAAVAIAVGVAGMTAAAGSAGPPDLGRATGASETGPLAGTWVGVLRGSVAGRTRVQRIVIAVDARESAGTWRITSTCRGTLGLDSVSGGYHHYRRRSVSGASCLAGDVDCLMRVGPALYDSVTPHPGGPALSGTLHRARTTAGA